LNNFLLLINELGNKIFTLDDNDGYVLELIENSILSLYNNILMIFTSSLHNVQLHNISTTFHCAPGFKIFTKEEYGDVKHNISYFINSFRIQHYKGLIKLVFNDINNLPNNIMFIGIDLVKRKNDNVCDILNKCKQNVNKTIDKIKIIQMNYIQISNSLQNITDNLCLKI
jgi:hypothetical protein